MQLTVGIGLLGCGTIGENVAERFVTERDAIERTGGTRYDLRAIAVRDLDRARSSLLDRGLFTRDTRAVIDDPQTDIIIECIGGTTDAAEYVERALDRGRHVVSANKDLMATQGPRLRALAAIRGVTLQYEAAVCGAVPIIRTLGEALAGDHVHAIAGILNGSTNAILCAMEDGAEYDEALAYAQRMGYTEADPSNDVDGLDAAHKLAILIQVAFGLAVISPRIRHSGIAGIRKRDIARALILGYRIRLLALAARTQRGVIADVAPVLVPVDHPFAHTRGAENVVRIIARDAGPLVLRGLGAGGAATASAVLGDTVAALRAIGERHDMRYGRHARIDPAIDVTPCFSRFPHLPELPRFARWDDALLDAPATHADAISRPGKERFR